MKKLILTAMTAALLATPMAASAQGRTVVKERPGRTVVVEKNRHGQNVRRTVVRQQPVGHARWQRGQRFDRNRAPNYRQIDYRAYRQRGVYAPPRGYQWVRSGNDAVLIAIASGVIGAVIGGAIAN
ncbi:RcnB family protein [Sphingomonas sp. 2R-10]|uniref:RcnB family protein n=1 Tax=Sphingomonas sp. 2R-10 TaxID=3045148 RepID=UPI000F7882B8|nr:RcnB family protein [Sphingomonas sp. 2R-10]MDJ0277458.1 RcnB family protein [Sphingomonas sp. 2R-10]